VSAHIARIATSDRLTRIVVYLTMRGGMGATTIDMMDDLRTSNPGGDVSEVNANWRLSGDERLIVCKYERMTDDGRKVYRYRIVKRDEVAA